MKKLICFFVVFCMMCAMSASVFATDDLAENAAIYVDETFYRAEDGGVVFNEEDFNTKPLSIYSKKFSAHFTQITITNNGDATLYISIDDGEVKTYVSSGDKKIIIYTSYDYHEITLTSYKTINFIYSIK